MKTALAASLLAIAFAAAPAYAGPLGTTVHGEMLIYSTNYFDPNNGYVPGGYGNTASDDVLVTDPGTEFGFNDGANQDTADFTGSQLFLTDVSAGGSIEITYRFTALTPGAFGNVTLASNSLPGMNWSLAGDVLTINVSQFQSGGTYQGVFNFSNGAVPEPASWAMMLGGFGAIGGAMRSRRKAGIAFA